MFTCGSGLTTTVSAVELDEVVEVDKDEVGRVFEGEGGGDKAGTVVMEGDGKVGNENGEDKFRLLL